MCRGCPSQWTSRLKCNTFPVLKELRRVSWARDGESGAVDGRTTLGRRWLNVLHSYTPCILAGPGVGDSGALFSDGKLASDMRI